MSTDSPGLTPNEEQLYAQDEADEQARTLILGDNITAAQQLGQQVAMYREQIAVTQDPMVKSLIVAAASGALREMLNDLWPLIEQLRGKPFGFVTDRDKPDKNGQQKPPYGRDVCLDCGVVALLKGAQFAGNQFNIIAGDCYITQAGMEAAVVPGPGGGGYPGLTEWDHEIGTSPEVVNGTALVKAWATWKLNGVKQGISYGGKLVPGTPPRPAIPVVWNKGMKIEAVLGKAKRKLFARVLEKLTGQAPLTIDDDGNPDEDLNFVEALTLDGKVAEKPAATPAAAAPTAPAVPTTPASTPPAVDPGSINQWMSLDIINGCASVLDVNNYEKQVTELVKMAAKDGSLAEGKVAPILGALTAACISRRNEIRGTRGPRSNDGSGEEGGGDA